MVEPRGQSKSYRQYSHNGPVVDDAAPGEMGQFEITLRSVRERQQVKRFQCLLTTIQHGGAPGERERGEAGVLSAFQLAAQHITLAQALQPSKEVYRKSLQVRQFMEF